MKKELTLKQIYILEKAKDVSVHQQIDLKKHMKGQKLVQLLNKNGFKTSYGTKYIGGRGVYTLIKSTYKALMNNEDYENATLIANAFKNAKGKYAY